MSATPLLHFDIDASTSETSNYAPSEKVFISNPQERVLQAQQDGEAFTRERIASGNLIVDSDGNLQVTQQWISRIKESLDSNYDVVSDGAAIVLINFH